MARAVSAARVRCHVAVASLNAHLWAVELQVPLAAHTGKHIEASLPVWIAGSYMVREFSKHLQGMRAYIDGKAVEVLQLNKNTWRVNKLPGAKQLVLRYEVYANDHSVRTSWLGHRRGFFNSTSLCLRMRGLDDLAHELHVSATPTTPNWQVFTGLQSLKTDAKGFGSYLAANYDELADCPVEMGPVIANACEAGHWVGRFEARGVPHEFVVAGAPPGFDGARLLRDTQRVCEAIIDLWGQNAQGKGAQATPMQRYVFMLNAVDDAYGGLEHRNSTALIAKRADLPRTDAPGNSEGYTALLGLISHEYFHTWNVKSLKPAEFKRYAFDAEQYTELLWFFEGFTSYYDDLMLWRAGLIDHNVYLKLLSKTLNAVLTTPGRRVQSVAQASFDAWVKYYRQDENTPNATVSYYTKGALVALCLDLHLRAEPKKPTTLDAVMRALWARCNAAPGNDRGAMTEADVLAVLKTLTGRSWQTEIDAWVHGTDDLPLQTALARMGVGWSDDSPNWSARLGARVNEGNGITIKQVMRESAAEAAGLCAGDEWIGAAAIHEPKRGKPQVGSFWRLHKLDDLSQLFAGVGALQVWIARDREMLQLRLDLPKVAGALARPVRLSWANAPLAAAWGPVAAKV